jgi:hypothetical protein
MVSGNNNDLIQYDQVEEANAPRYATEEEILASFGYKQVKEWLIYPNVPASSNFFLKRK